MKGVLVESVRNVEVISMTVKNTMPATFSIHKLIIISKCYLQMLFVTNFIRVNKSNSIVVSNRK